MDRIKCADRMQKVHSDIRGPLFVEAMEMQHKGIEILKLPSNFVRPDKPVLPSNIKISRRKIRL